MKFMLELSYQDLKTAVNSGALMFLADTIESSKATNEAKSQEKTKPEEKSSPTLTPAAVEISTEENQEKTYTLEEVRAKLAALSRSGKQAQIKEIIASFGVNKLTEIPAEKYPEVMAKAEKIEKGEQK